MTLHRVVSITLVAALGIGCAARRAEEPEACLVAPGITYELDRLRMLAGGVDPGSVRVRAAVRLPALPMPPSEIVVVRSSAVCAAAAKAYWSSDAKRVDPVWVFELGSTYYAVHHPAARLGEWGNMTLMTREFVVVHRLLW